MSAAEKVAVVIGIGPGLGQAVAVRFAKEGFRIALVARNQESVASTQAAIDSAGGTARSYLADATDEKSVQGTFVKIHQELGPTEVLVYNAAIFKVAGILDLTGEAFEQAWRVGCLGGFFAAQAVLPGMIERGRGTLLFSGATASLRGGAKFSAVAVGKFGLRALAQSIAREFGPKGIHAAHVVIDGQIDAPRVRSGLPSRDPKTFLDPAAIAETYWSLHAQDVSAWTQEIDLRPSVEKF